MAHMLHHVSDVEDAMAEHGETRGTSSGGRHWGVPGRSVASLLLPLVALLVVQGCIVVQGCSGSSDSAGGATPSQLQNSDVVVGQFASGVASSDPATTGVSVWDFDLVSNGGSKSLVAIGYAVDDNGPPRDVLEIAFDGNLLYLRDPSGDAVTVSPERAAGIGSDFATMAKGLPPTSQSAGTSGEESVSGRLGMTDLTLSKLGICAASEFGTLALAAGTVLGVVGTTYVCTVGEAVTLGAATPGCGVAFGMSVFAGVSTAALFQYSVDCFKDLAN
jgi:hypothetical protein